MKTFLTLLLFCSCVVCASAQRLPRKLPLPKAKPTHITLPKTAPINPAMSRQVAAQTLCAKPLQPAEIFALTRPAVFLAPTPMKNSFSGSIFKIQHNGKTEIFGAVAVHALLDEYLTPGSLGRNFEAVVQTGTADTPLPVEVVQLSSAKTMDIALVKFRPQDEPLVRPLLLESNPPKAGSFLYGQGFAHNKLMQEEMMLSPRTSSGGMRQASLSFADLQARLGFCGSPIVNDAAELSGVFVGVGRDSYIGFMATARQLEKLVQAYHHPQQPVLEIKLQGKELLRLPADEYISQFELLDENKQFLWASTTAKKMTTTPVEQALWKYPATRYVRFIIGKTAWKQVNGQWTVSDNARVREQVVPFIPAR